MNLDEAIAVLRGRLDDEIVPYLWSNADFISYFNQRRNDFARRTEYFRDSSTAAICTLTMLTSTANYALDTRIVDVKRAKPSWMTIPLKKVTVGFMDENTPGWEDSDTSTQPYRFILDKLTGYLTVWPTPASAIGTVKLTVSRLPLTQLALSHIGLSTPTELDFPLMWQETLLEAVMGLAYAKPDSQTRDQGKAQEYSQKWERFIMVDMVQYITKQGSSDEDQPDYYRER